MNEIGDFGTQPWQTGWVCPKCGRVMAPWATSCTRCDGSSSDVITSNHTFTTNNNLKPNTINYGPYCEEFKSF